MPDHPVGVIDTPGKDCEIDGPACVVSGWIVFPDASVDYIDVFCDGEPAGRAAWGHARPDIATVMPDTGLDGLTAGFRAVIPVHAGPTGRTCIVQVRATASDATVWHSPEHPFIVRAEREDGDVAPLPTIPELAGPIAARGSTARRRWVVFTHALTLGGGELYLQELLLRLQAGGRAEILVVAPGSGPLHAELERAGISVHVTAGYPIDPDHYAGRMTELTGLLRAWGAEIVLANTLALFPAVDAALEAGLPAIWAIHESFSLPVFSFLCWGPGALTPAVHDRWERALLGAELVYEADATLRLHAGDLPGVRARQIRYGIDLERIARYRATHPREEVRASLGFAAGDRVLLCMGVIQERKGQIPLLRAFLRATTEHPDTRLVFVGDHDAEYPKALRECVSTLGVEDVVTIVKTDPDTYRWYSAADVLVSASDVESLPRSILEAQAFGLPVLAADVFGVREVVRDGITGWLFESRRSQAMITAVARVLATDDEELSAFSRRALAAGLEHDGAGYADAYTRLADELCARGRTPVNADRPEVRV